MSDSHQAAPASLVVGASGLVGGALLRELGRAAVGTYRTRPQPGLRHLDACDTAASRSLIDELRPQVIYFPAAEPHVDWCEIHPAEAHAANVAPALNMLRAAVDTGAQLVFFSTDYVFDGGAGPYREEDVPNPVSVYGQHKREVEERVLAAGRTVVRTTTVYGEEQPPGKNFVTRLVANLRSGTSVKLPSDQLSTPTWARELARTSVAVAGRPGVWHVAGPELLARDAFARLIAEVFASDPLLIEPVTTAELQQAARRPLRGGLIAEKARSATGRPALPTREALLQHKASIGG